MVRRSPEIARDFVTACKYDRCVAGEGLRTVISSIIRRCSGLISVIVISCLKFGQDTPIPSNAKRHWQISSPNFRASGFVQSPFSDSVRLKRVAPNLIQDSVFA
jgi:hypothetical protein